MRRAHILRHNENTETPQAAIFFDTETTPETVDAKTIKHRLAFGWLAYIRRRSNGEWTKPKWSRFETRSEFWDIVEGLLRPKVRTYAFCHNTAFDLPVLDVFGQLGSRSFKISTCIIDAPPTIIKARRDGKTLLILDTLNIWRMPLAKIGGHVGLKKLDMPASWTVTQEGDAYCKRDVEILIEAFKAWTKTLLDHDLGGFAPTLAAQSLRTYRHRFMSYPILIDDNDRALALAREGYHGGRVECFRIGKFTGDFVLLDVNSMYPYVMREHEYPTKLLSHIIHCTVEQLIREAKAGPVMARVTVETHEPAYAVMRDGKLIFPTGRFETVLTTTEILHAARRKHIVDVSEMCIYEGARIFKTFVDYFYAARMDAAAGGDDAESWRIKILMTNLYGKFGQRGVVWEREKDTDDLSAETWTEINAQSGKITRWRRLGGIVQRQEREEESRDSFPAIAAHVTAYARMYLWRLAQRAGSSNMFYCDTDSLLVKRPALRRLAPFIDATRLGGLKEEGTFEEVEIYGPKDYRFGTKERHKGVKSKASWLTANKVRQEQWSGLWAGVQNSDDPAPTTKTIEKTLARVYTKGTVCRNGRVKPLILED